MLITRRPCRAREQSGDLNGEHDAEDEYTNVRVGPWHLAKCRCVGMPEAYCIPRQSLPNLGGLHAWLEKCGCKAFLTKKRNAVPRFSFCHNHFFAAADLLRQQDVERILGRVRPGERARRGGRHHNRRAPGRT